MYVLNNKQISLIFWHNWDGMHTNHPSKAQSDPYIITLLTVHTASTTFFRYFTLPTFTPHTPISKCLYINDSKSRIQIHTHIWTTVPKGKSIGVILHSYAMRYLQTGLAKSQESTWKVIFLLFRSKNHIIWVVSGLVCVYYGRRVEGRARTRQNEVLAKSLKRVEKP